MKNNVDKPGPAGGNGRERNDRSAVAPSPAAEAAPQVAEEHRSAGPTLASVIQPADAVLIYSHMNPDPDTVGAALGLKHLVAEAYGKKVTVCYRGLIGRAENRELMRLLGTEIVHASQVDQSAYEVALLVDSQPDYGFIPSLDRVPVVGVIDHHPFVKSTGEVPFTDVRPDYGATSTIVTEYLREAGLEPGPQVATALFYGVKTDTQDLSRRTGAPDVSAYNWLLSRLDRRILSRIESPPLSRAYYEQFVFAVGRAMIYQRAILTELGEMAYPDMVAEIADRLIRLDGMDWSVCFGSHSQRVYMSVRTTHPVYDAGILVKTALRDEGVGGGHDTMAAGRVQLADTSEATYVRTVQTLWSRFLEAMGEDAATGRRMMSCSSIQLRVPGDAPGAG